MCPIFWCDDNLSHFAVIALLIRALSTPLGGFTSLWSWHVGSWISAWNFLCFHRLETARRPVFQLAEGRVDQESQCWPAFPAACCPEAVRQPCALPVMPVLPTVALLKGIVRWDYFSNAWTSESLRTGLGPLDPRRDGPDPQSASKPTRSQRLLGTTGWEGLGAHVSCTAHTWAERCLVSASPVGVRLSQPCAALSFSLHVLWSLAAGGDVGEALDTRIPFTWGQGTSRTPAHTENGEGHVLRWTARSLWSAERRGEGSVRGGRAAWHSLCSVQPVGQCLRAPGSVCSCPCLSAGGWQKGPQGPPIPCLCHS